MRFLHRIYAAIGGYFWMPCPVCERMFGGHESSLGRSPLIVNERAWVVCSDACGDEAATRNTANGHSPYPYTKWSHYATPAPS
jgi:hypothetical protein